jgi:hypothetical protein
MAAPERDKFAHIRLDDLPNAGYSTSREKELSDTVMFFIRGAERDRLWLLSMVCDGKDKFRAVLRNAWAHLKADHELIDAVYGYLVLLAGKFPHLQRDELIRLGRMGPVKRMHHITGISRQ